MYLTAERLALANQAILEAFENTCIAWQTIPHWKTTDPGQTRVPAEKVDGSASVQDIDGDTEKFNVTFALACAPDPDQLINTLVAKTLALAAKVDGKIIPLLLQESKTKVTYNESSVDGILDGLIDARVEAETSGARAPSCLITDKAGIKKLNQLISGYSPLESLLTAGNINTLHRADQLGPGSGGKAARGVLIGRRQRIASGEAARASAGEEPVDLVVSVPPTLEVVGENGDNKIAMTVRIRYALRVKDSRGVVGLIAP
ncbi:hypothetical protein ACQI4F_01175 [Mycolicibacterium vaccae]|uniref:hypothetical protein n=1 Tax=Mycolicibacterium vaccae TaxID=1810 RepID=UPI003CE9D7F2